MENAILEIAKKLAENSPAALVMLVVVWYFIRYIQRRDDQETQLAKIRMDNEQRRSVQDDTRNKETLTVLSEMTKVIADVSVNQEQHHKAMLDAVSQMRNATRRRKDDPK